MDEHQKTDERGNKLIPFREEMLNSIGFVWDEKGTQLEAMFAL